MKLLTLPQAEDVTLNRINHLMLDLQEKDPLYIMLTVTMLIDVLEDYEGYAAENALYKLIETKAWLDKGFGDEAL